MAAVLNLLKAMLPAYQKKKYRGSAYLSGSPDHAPAPWLLVLAVGAELVTSSASAFGSFVLFAGVVAFLTVLGAGSLVVDFESVAAFSFLAGGVADGLAGVAFFFTAGLLLFAALFGVALVAVEDFFGDDILTAGLFGAALAVVERAMV